MNIGFIAPYKDGTGYAHSAVEFIKCLSSIDGINVVPLWVTLSNRPTHIDEEIEKLEDNIANNIDDIDICIQYILPQYFVKLSIPTIGIFCYETNHFRGSNWSYSCNLMDHIWVLTPECKEACANSNVKVPVHEVNQPHDFNKYNKDYKSLFPEFNNSNYVFYTISEISYRKNISGLLLVYLTEFSNEDSVILLIKGFYDHRNPQETEKEFEVLIQEIKRGINRNTSCYPPVVFVSDWLSEEQIYQLHACGDCFVTLSRGEAWCMPLFDAVCMGKVCIGPDWNGPKKILANTNHNLIPTTTKPVIGMNNTLPNLYLYDENWQEPSLTMAKKALRDNYDAWTLSGIHSSNSIKSLEHRYSYETVGNELLNLLQEIKV